MTTLSRLLARFLPAPLVLPALAIVYAAMALAIIAVGSAIGTDIVYIDIEGR